MAGIEQLLKRSTKAEVASVLLFTDGLANYGVTAVPQLVSAMTAMLGKVRSPCTVFTFGFGKDHSEKMLHALADAARGFYYYIEARQKLCKRMPDFVLLFQHSASINASHQTADNIPQAFADCIGGLLSVAAQNITVTIKGTAGVQVEAVPTKRIFAHCVT